MNIDHIKILLSWTIYMVRKYNFEFTVNLWAAICSILQWKPHWILCFFFSRKFWEKQQLNRYTKITDCFITFRTRKIWTKGKLPIETEQKRERGAEKICCTHSTTLEYILPYRWCTPYFISITNYKVINYIIHMCICFLQPTLLSLSLSFVRQFLHAIAPSWKTESVKFLQWLKYDNNNSFHFDQWCAMRPYTRQNFMLMIWIENSIALLFM